MVNISQQAGAFFQTDADIAKQKEKEAKYNYTEGDAIQLASKALDVRLFGNHLYVAESGFQVRKISLTSWKSVKLFKGHTGPVTCLAFTSTHMYTGSWDKTIKQWNLETGECLATLEGHTDFIKSLVVIGNALYSGSSDCFLRRWDLDTLTCTFTEKKHKRAIESLAASENGQSIFTGSSDGTVIRWDVSTMKPVRTYTGHDTSIYCVRVWEEDLWTASADKTVRRFNIETGVQDTVLTHPDRVKSIVLAGPYIVTGSSDDDIRVWDIGSSKLICTIEGHFDEVSCLDIAGSTLYSGSLDCSLRKWALTAEAIKKYNETREAKVKRLQEEEEQKKKKSTGLTEEEERELEELMLSDED